jgi:DNA-binding MarR family transcriptional regulator
MDDRERLLSVHLEALVAMVRSDEPDLTDRQKCVFLKVYLDEEGQTVRGLASYANISKPAITRALDRLQVFDLVRRRTDPADRRSVIVVRTPQGRQFFRKMGDIAMDANRRITTLAARQSRDAPSA